MPICLPLDNVDRLPCRPIRGGRAAATATTCRARSAGHKLVRRPQLGVVRNRRRAGHPHSDGGSAATATPAAAGATIPARATACAVEGPRQGRRRSFAARDGASQRTAAAAATVAARPAVAATPAETRDETHASERKRRCRAELDCITHEHGHRRTAARAFSAGATAASSGATAASPAAESIGKLTLAAEPLHLSATARTTAASP